MRVVHCFQLFLILTLANIAESKKVCRDGSGKHEEGTKWTYDCNKKTCIEGRVKVLKYGCPIKRGKCIGVGEKYERACMTYTCKRSNKQQAGLVPTSRACMSATTGQCVKLWQTWYESCSVFRCVEDGEYTARQPVKLMCVTANYGCVNIGSSNFPCFIRGSYKPRCRCYQNDTGTVTYVAS